MLSVCLVVMLMMALFTAKVIFRLHTLVPCFALLVCCAAFMLPGNALHCGSHPRWLLTMMIGLLRVGEASNPGPLAHFRSRGQGRGKLGNFCENQVALLAQRIRDTLETCTSCTMKIHMLGVECGFKDEPSWVIEPVLTTCFLPAGGLLPSFGQKWVHDPNKEEFWIRSEAPNQILAKSRQCSE